MIRSLFVAPLALTALTSTALAHFQLIEPKQDRADLQGKTARCGNDQPAADAVVTTYQAGQTIMLKVKETIGHTGHYRAALAQTIDDLPNAPEVTASCGTAKIVADPKPPLLADGFFDKLAEGQTGEHPIKLPDAACQNCILQVIQFMSNENGDCFYYHCAKVNIVAGGPAPDAGPTAPAPDGGPDDGNSNNSGGGSTGGCSTTTGQVGWALVALGALLPAVRRRRGA